jgi:DNA-binding LacI/PurR family transcriptional regulator/DNA-binding transcriptional regulator YhcF (GntR family)
VNTALAIQTHRDQDTYYHREPAYFRIAKEIRGRVRAGSIAPGSKLASRRHLASEYGVALATIERAIDCLIEDGMLRADGARGTFVNPRALLLGAEKSEPDEYDLSPQRPAMPSMDAVSRPQSAPRIGVVGDHVIGVRLEGLEDYWKLRALHSVEETVGEKLGSTEIIDLHLRYGETEGLDDAISAAGRDGVDGFIFIDLDYTSEFIDMAARAVTATRKPYVFVSSLELASTVPHVCYDHYTAGYQAASHFLANGYDSICFVGHADVEWVNMRLSGARSALGHAGMDPSALRAFLVAENLPVDGTSASFEDVAQTGYRQFKSAYPAYSAVIAANDHTARAFMQAASEDGLTSGVDYGIVAFDDTVNARPLGLTSLRPPVGAMAREAASLLLRSIGGYEGMTKISLKSQLIPRASSRPRPGVSKRETGLCLAD